MLAEREKVDPALASYISEKAWEVSRDVREAVRIGKICRSREEVEQDVRLIRKYALVRSS